MWSRALKAALLSGSAASVASTFALLWCGRQDVHDGAAPLNGPSQWIWGTAAPYSSGFSVRHTVVGYLIHHLASIFWAVFFERWRPGRPEAMPAVAAAALTSATASIVDYQLTPQRFRPGFEKRLSRPSLTLVYAAFAAGLAAAAIVTSLAQNRGITARRNRRAVAR
ncbi:MAG TPA: hypothetical protein VFP36_15425 [Usitatibacter sp.]|nr:hypothetical protein [Usitatibacter sp.]